MSRAGEAATLAALALLALTGFVLWEREGLTLVTGADAEPGLADAVAEHAREGRPEVDTVQYDGGQPRYPLLIGVE